MDTENESLESSQHKKDVSIPENTCCAAQSGIFPVLSNRKDLGTQMALAETSNKISSRALLGASRFKLSANHLPEPAVDPSEATRLTAARRFLSAAPPADSSELRCGEWPRRDRPPAPGSDTNTPLASGCSNFAEAGDKASALLEEMLREASLVRGIQLNCFFYAMSFLVALVFSLLFGQLYIVIEDKRAVLEKEAVSISAVTAVNQVDWLYYNVNSVMRFFEFSSSLIKNLSASDKIFTQLCKSVGGSPLVFATYKNPSAALIEFYSCPLAVSEGVKPPPLLNNISELKSGLLRMSIYSSEFIIASILSTNNSEFLVVLLHKELVSRLLLANSNSVYSTPTLKQSTTALLLPDFFTSKLVVMSNSLNHEYMNYSASYQMSLGLSLQSAFENICASGKEYTWHTAMHLAYNESYTWERNHKQTYNNMSAFYIEKKSFWGGKLRVVMCGVVCSVPAGNYCASDNPTNTWFVVTNEPLVEETEVAFFAIKSVTLIAVILFFLMVAIVHLSVSIPVQHLKFLIFDTVGDKREKHFCNKLLFQYTRHYWLGELQALIRTFQLLCFCFCLNKKYVPQHVLEQQVLALRTSKDYVWRTIVEKIDTSEIYKEEGDDDGVTNEQEVMEAFVNTVSSAENQFPDFSTLRVSKALLRRDSGMRSATLSEGDLGETNLSFATEQSTTDLERHRMTLVEGATILAVHLCAVEMAYFTNYYAALKQHRRIMNYLLERIRHYRGELFERSGDCIAAAWNAFESRVNHASCAASCALSIARVLAQYRQAGFRVGIVLHQGPFVCGVVEDNKEAFTTVFGTVPRQAIALAELAASLPCFNVLVSEPVKQSLASLFECIIVDVIKYHENDNPIVMFELSEERRLVSAKGTPLTPSLFAEEHARVFFDFRYHNFEAALTGVERLRRRFPGSGSQLLKRIELLCNFYMHRKHELPMPYFRPYPTWSNYEAIANADYIADVPVEGMKESCLSDSLRLARTRSIFEDDTAKFRKDLHENVLACRRTQNPASVTPALHPDSIKATRAANLNVTRLDAKAKKKGLGTVVVGRQSPSRPLRRAQSEPLFSTAGKITNSGDDEFQGARRTAVVERHDVYRRVFMCSATTTTVSSIVGVSRGEKANCINSSKPRRSIFDKSLRPSLFDGCASNFFRGNDSFISLNSGALQTFTSFGDVDNSFRVVDQFPQTIVAKNGIEYIRSSRILGKGSFGRVYLGMETLSGRFVAIKFLPLPSDEEEIAKVESEVVTMQEVKSNHVVEFISYAFVKNFIVIVMECMMAGSLQGLISGFGKFHSATARLFIRDVLRGLHRLHSKGIIHRDVKPQNVLHSLTGSCKISDFGASAFLHELVRKQMEGKGLQVQGTPVYLAPEAARGKPEEKSDIWSCGVMFLQLLTKRLPYAEEFLQMPPQILVYQIGSGAAKPIIPESLDEFDAYFVRSCLQEDPKQRLSAKELLELPLFGL